MTKNTDTSSFPLLAHEAGFDPIEERLRLNVRATIEAVFEEELADFLGRLRYSRGTGATKGYRHGHRERQLTGAFWTETVRVPRARIEDETGRLTEWRSKARPLTPHQHPARQASVVRAVRGRCEPGRGQPGLAQGEDGLGCVVRRQPRR